VIKAKLDSIVIDTIQYKINLHQNHHLLTNPRGLSRT